MLRLVSRKTPEQDIAIINTSGPSGECTFWDLGGIFVFVANFVVCCGSYQPKCCKIPQCWYQDIFYWNSFLCRTIKLTKVGWNRRSNHIFKLRLQRCTLDFFPPIISLDGSSYFVYTAESCIKTVCWNSWLCAKCNRFYVMLCAFV